MIARRLGMAAPKTADTAKRDGDKNQDRNRNRNPAEPQAVGSGGVSPSDGNKYYHIWKYVLLSMVAAVI